MSASSDKIISGPLMDDPLLESASSNAELDNDPLYERDDKRGSHRLAFAGLFLFTLLLYLRPNEVFPGLVGQFPIVKIVTIFTLLAYFGSKLSRAERLTILPLEMKMLALIVLLGIIFIPLAVERQQSVDMLTDTFLKVVTIFVLMINLIDSKKRLFSILRLVVICGTVIALFAISNYLSGESIAQSDGTRIVGIFGGIFGNPNDLATGLDLLLPLAVALALSRKGIARVFYFACAAALGFGVIITFSRGGFLGLMAMGGVLLWKAGRHNRLVMVMVAFMAVGVFSSAVPNGYTDRLFTILHTEKDTTGSAQQRQEILKRAVDLASRHLLFGVGMGNFGVYSIHNLKAHNSYLEISTELGVAGLIAYLILIFRPLRSLRRIERRSAPARRKRDQEIYYLSIGVQAAIVAYMVCSFFSSIQYLWYLYYLVAYAVSLGRLEPKEEEPIDADMVDMTEDY